MIKNENIRNLFYPKAIAVVGASSKEKSIGYEILNSIKQYKFKGKVYPVNPHADNILGFKCVNKIAELPTNIDMAIIVVPKNFVEESIVNLLNKNIKTFILITAGFRETGKEGAEAERRIIKLINAQKANLIGPNCMGVINTLESIKLNATFVAESPEKGAIGFLSQSGALGAAVLNSLRETDIRFAHFISVGNKADLNENDITKFWNKDNNIKILAYYLESFEDGLEFIKMFLTNKIKKPAIVLKAGRSKSGMEAASSHTGAVSAPDFIIDSLLTQAGIIRAANLNELFNIAKGFESFPLPKGNNIAVVTNAGGPAILSVDALERNNLSLAKLNDDSINKLRRIVNPNGSIKNPIDLLPGATKNDYYDVIKILLSDQNVDAIISIFVEPVMVEPFGVIEKINSLKARKPILQVAMPLPEFWGKYRNESIYKLPIFRNPEDPAIVLSKMLFFKKRKEILLLEKDKYKKLFSIATKKYSIKDHKQLTHIEVNNLLSEYDIPLVKEKIIKPKHLLNQKFTYPLVLKGINNSITHKTEYSAVVTDIKSKDELKISAENIERSFAKNNLEVEYFLIQPLIKTKFELLIGGLKDKSFGAIITFGTGGKYVEAYRDISVASAYSTERDIRNLIASTKIGKIISGWRNEKSVNIDYLISIIKNISLLLIENDVKEIDLNPLIIDEQFNFHVVDARINF